MPTKHKARGRPRKKTKRAPAHPHGGSFITAIRTAPQLLKALAKALAIKTAKKTAAPAALGTAAGSYGYYHGKKAPRATGWV